VTTAALEAADAQLLAEAIATLGRPPVSSYAG